jgi:hypothetical protein
MNLFTCSTTLESKKLEDNLDGIQENIKNEESPISPKTPTAADPKKSSDAMLKGSPNPCSKIGPV